MPVHVRLTMDKVSQEQLYIRVLNILAFQCLSTRIPHSFIRLRPTQLAPSFNYMLKNCSLSDPGGSTIQDVVLRSLACWNSGFEFRWGHGCLSVRCVVCCQVEFCAMEQTLVQRSPTECERVCVSVCACVCH
jgi:hypothetical protein